jgi:hypothetical protein
MRKFAILVLSLILCLSALPLTVFAEADSFTLILHAGDFCNDYPGSPEILRPLLQNPYGLAVYGCYGNHELETPGTAMAFVTPHLTNRDVCWGTANGRLGDGDIGYYYFDRDGYRFVVTDTNYSLRPDGAWEHNRTGSHCPVRENTAWNSLGPDQLAWLEGVLKDAAERALRCIVLSHTAFNLRKGASPDAAAVRAIFHSVNTRRPGTVLLAINGHHHTDGASVEDGILYFDVNAVRNAWWQATDHNKYAADAPTFPFIPYNDDGVPTAPATQRPLRSLRQGNHTLFTRDPLSAVLTVLEDGTVEIEGTASRWVAEIAPDSPQDNVVPLIRDRRIKI